MQRKDEILAKRAKLAEIRRQREEREQRQKGSGIRESAASEPSEVPCPYYDQDSGLSLTHVRSNHRHLYALRIEKSLTASLTRWSERGPRLEVQEHLRLLVARAIQAQRLVPGK